LFRSARFLICYPAVTAGHARWLGDVDSSLVETAKCPGCGATIDDIETVDVSFLRRYANIKILKVACTACGVVIGTVAEQET
jgi:hypothetical protein